MVNTLQIFFDFLGEVIKYNKFTYQIMMKLLEENGNYEKFLELIKKDLINSNVLVRSILLTDYKIKESRTKDRFNNLEICNSTDGLIDNKLVKGIKDELLNICIGLINAVVSESLSSESIFIY